MTGRTHDLAAAVALAVAVIVWPPASLTLGTAIVALIANQLGGIAPDIDEPTAPLWRNLPIGRLFGRFAGRLLGGHRFLTHSLLGAALFGWLTWLLLQFLQPVMPRIDIHLVWLAFMVGLISHLIMDTLTKEGVPWLLPIPIKFGFPPLRAWRITTGTNAEAFIVFPVLIAAGVWWGFINYDQFAALVHHIAR